MNICRHHVAAIASGDFDEFIENLSAIAERSLLAMNEHLSDEAFLFLDLVGQESEITPKARLPHALVNVLRVKSILTAHVISLPDALALTTAAELARAEMNPPADKM